MEKFWED